MKPILVVIYNHHFTKNIDRVEKIYEGRFSKIYHLMPFYRGSQENVIPVYENSRNFQGYIAQGFSTYFDADASHYLFVADDLIVNPEISERNYASHLAIDSESSFTPGLVPLDQFHNNWAHLRDAYKYNVRQVGLELDGQLPSVDAARHLIEAHGAKVANLNFEAVFPREHRNTTAFRAIVAELRWQIRRLRYSRHQFPLSYPLVGGYSDFIAVSQNAIREFCHYCGVFAASSLFVELAIPTALAFASKRISTEANTPKKGKAMWTSEDGQFLEKFGKDLAKLMKDFPTNCLYIHPVKLSQWT